MTVTAWTMFWLETTIFQTYSCRRKAASLDDGDGCDSEYLQEYCPDRYNELLLSGKLWTYLADLNEQAQNRLDYIIVQMKEAEGIMEELKACDQMAWVRAMNSIRNRAEEIIRSEMIYC